MKSFLFSFLIAFLPLFAWSQDIEPVTFGSNHYKINLGDTIAVGLPAGSKNQFLFILNDTTAAFVASTINKAQSQEITFVSSEDFIEKVASGMADKDTEASQVGSVWIKNENPLTNRVLRIIRFEQYTDREGKQRTSAIAEADAGAKLKIDLERAINAGEISEHNDRIFERFLERISRKNDN